MITTTIDTTVPFTVGPWKIVVVESTGYAAASIDGGLMATVMRRPITIIVRYPDGDRAFDLTGREIPNRRQ